LHRCKSRRGEQHETKFCHDGLSPRKIIENKIRWINEYALGRIVAAFAHGLVFISENMEPDISAFIAYSGDHFKRYVSAPQRPSRATGACHRRATLKVQERPASGAA
jgi:hypothetical protein